MNENMKRMSATKRTTGFDFLGRSVEGVTKMDNDFLYFYWLMDRIADPLF